jgi:hypothetical protein
LNNRKTALAVTIERRKERKQFCALFLADIEPLSTDFVAVCVAKFRPRVPQGAIPLPDAERYIWAAQTPAAVQAKNA